MIAGPHLSPPPFVVMNLPLGVLDFPTAFGVWNLISLTSFGISVLIAFLRLKPPLPVWSYPILAILFLLSAPFWSQLANGHQGFVVAALVIGAWCADRSKRNVLAGILLGFATAINMSVAFLAVYFAATKRVRTLVAFALTTVCLWSEAVVILGPDAVYAYGKAFLDGTLPGVATPYSLSLTSCLYQLFALVFTFVDQTTFSPAIATIVVSLVVFLGLTALVVRSARSAEGEVAAARSFTLALIGAALLARDTLASDCLALGFFVVCLLAFAARPSCIAWGGFTLFILALKPAGLADALSALLGINDPAGQSVGILGWQLALLTQIVHCLALLSLVRQTRRFALTSHGQPANNDVEQALFTVSVSSQHLEKRAL